jgi:uncharacterized protein YjiS (DUF1127 family)
LRPAVFLVFYFSVRTHACAAWDHCVLVHCADAETTLTGWQWRHDAASKYAFQGTVQMAFYDNARIAHGLGFATRAATVFTRIAEAVTAWNDARVTRKALAQLSDRELDDIGLCRGDIDLVVNRH